MSLPSVIHGTSIPVVLDISPLGFKDMVAFGTVTRLPLWPSGMHCRSIWIRCVLEPRCTESERKTNIRNTGNNTKLKLNSSIMEFELQWLAHGSCFAGSGSQQNSSDKASLSKALVAGPLFPRARLFFCGCFLNFALHPFARCWGFAVKMPLCSPCRSCHPIQYSSTPRSRHDV